MFSAIFRKFNDFYDIYFFLYTCIDILTWLRFIQRFDFRFYLLLWILMKVKVHVDRECDNLGDGTIIAIIFFRKWTRLKNILKFPLFYFFVLAHWKKNTRYIIFNRREFIAWNFRYLLIFNILHSKIWNQIFTDSLLTFSRYYLYVVNLIVFS